MTTLIIRPVTKVQMSTFGDAFKGHVPQSVWYQGWEWVGPIVSFDDEGEVYVVKYWCGGRKLVIFRDAPTTP